MNILSNRLLFTLLAVLAGYWSIGMTIPGVILSSSLAVFSVLIGCAIVIRYWMGLYEVVWHRRRSRAQDGAHLAAVGIPAIAASVVYGGMFTLAWNLAGQPPDWLGTPASNFSRLLLVIGCIALYLTPDVEQQRLSLPGVIWLVAIMITAVVVAFTLGTYVGDLGTVTMYRACPIPT